MLDDKDKRRNFKNKMFFYLLITQRKHDESLSFDYPIYIDTS